MKIHIKEQLQWNIKEYMKPNCYLVTCFLLVDFKNGLKSFILLKTDKYSPAREHYGVLGNAMKLFQPNFLEVSWDQHKPRIYKNRKWKLSWRFGSIVLC